MIHKDDPSVGPSCGSLSNNSQLVSISSRDEDAEMTTTASGRPIQEARLSLSSVAMLQHYGDLTDIPTVAEEDDETEERQSANFFVMGASGPSGSSPPSASLTCAERLQSSFMELSDGTCYGYLWKFSIGKHFFSRSNWKRRYFTLSPSDRTRKSLLRYFKTDTSRDVVGEVELDASTTRIVSRPSTLTHKQASCLGRDICLFFRSADGGSNATEYRLLLRSDTTEDHDRWVAAFRVHFDVFDLASDHAC